MRLEKSGNKLIIHAGVSAKNSFLYISVGIVFLFFGIKTLGSGEKIGALFAVLGLFALIRFFWEHQHYFKAYIFDKSTQQLQVSDRTEIPFSGIEQVRVKENRWTGSYGESHRSYSVIIVGGISGSFSLPANSSGEAHKVVSQIQEWIGNE